MIKAYAFYMYTDIYLTKKKIIFKLKLILKNVSKIEMRNRYTIIT